MNNENLESKVTILPPFKKFCMTIGEIPSSYLESMTYYESLVWLCNYLEKTVIPAINANGEAVTELQEKYIELKDYVDNYFENLDIQEEINNKLDEMAEQGELATLIALYLEMGSILAYDTKSALKGAENLADGTTCKTLGETNYNDGKGNFYKIRLLEEGDVIDDDLLVALTNYPTLVAEKLIDYNINKLEKSLLIYDNINDMIMDDTLTTGNKVYVLGDITKGDGFSAYYSISDSGSVDGNYVIKLNNDLYAIMQNEIEENFYKEINYKRVRTNDTTYYLTNIPSKDSENNAITPYISARDYDLTPNEDAIKNNTNVTINASLSILVNGVWKEGIVIGNGEILNNYTIPGLTDGYTYFTILNDGTFKGYQANITSAQDMLNDGVTNAVLCWYQIIKNGSPQAAPEDLHFNNEYDCDQYIGQKSNGDIIILTSDGRNASNKGISQDQAKQIMLENNVVNAFMLDGGGSTSTSYRGIKINMDIDDNGTGDRKISYLFNVKKTITNKQTANIYGEIGKTKRLLNSQLRTLINDLGINNIGLARYKVNNFSSFNKGNNVILPLDFSGRDDSILLTRDTEHDDYYITVPKPGFLIIMASLRMLTTADDTAYLIFTEDNETRRSLPQHLAENERNTFNGIASINVLDPSSKMRIKMDANANSTIIENGEFTCLYFPNH